MKSLITFILISCSSLVATAQPNFQVVSSGLQQPAVKTAKINTALSSLAKLNHSYTDWSLNTDSTAKDSSKARKTDTTELKIGNTRVIFIGEPKIDRIEKTEKDSDAEEQESEKVTLSNKAPKKVQANYFNMDIGFLYLSNLSNLPKVALLELDNSKSMYVNIHIVDVSFSLYKNYVQLCTGIGYEFNNYRFAKDITLTPRIDSLQIITESIHFEKNKLLTQYLTIPLLLNIETNPSQPSKSFHISLGGEMGYFLKGKTKQISSEHGKVKQYDDFNAQALTLDFVGMLGYGDLSAFVKFNPFSGSQREVFKNNLMPNLTVVSFGISTAFN